MSAHIQIAHNAVVAQLRNATDEVKLGVSELLSYEVEGAEHTDAFKSKRWDGRSTFFEWNKAAFPAGFVPSVVDWLSRQGHLVQVLRPPLPAPLGAMPTMENPLVDNFKPDPRYDYQFKALAQLEKHGMMIARVATGGGKSRIARLCIQRIKRKTLFITTRKGLLYQFADACVESGMRVSTIGDSQWDASGDVVCAMVQTLSARLKMPPDGDTSPEAEQQRRNRAKAIEFLESVEFIVGEEAHESGGNGYYEALRYCKRAHYRLALTATPMMREAESNMRLLASFGPVRVEISEELLIKRGILATPKFKYVDVKAPSNLRQTTPWNKAIEVGIVMNAERNRAIVYEAARASRYGMPVVVLVTRRNHGEMLAKLMRDSGLRCEFIFGDTKDDKRKATLDKLASGVLQVVIGSTIIDVGVDVPALGMVILAGGGKAEVALRQRVGRALREKKNGPNIALIVDFIDSGNKHTKGHALTRRAIIEATPGFVEGILPKNADFDFAALGFERLVGIAA